MPKHKRTTAPTPSGGPPLWRKKLGCKRQLPSGAMDALLSWARLCFLRVLDMMVLNALKRNWHDEYTETFEAGRKTRVEVEEGP